MSARTRAMFRRMTGGFRRRFVVGLLASVLGALGLIQACTSENISGVVVGTVTISPSSQTVVVGETGDFDATVTDENGLTLSGAAVSWSITSEGGNVATIDGNGRVTGLAIGVAQVAATFQGSSDQATLTVQPPPVLAITPDSVAFYAGVGGPDPEPVALTVENAGSGTIEGLSAEIAYPEGEETDWLAIELSGSTTPADLEMAVSSVSLGSGRFTATVTLTTSDPEDPPFVVPVTFVRSSFTVTVPPEGLVVGEGGSEGTFSVALDVEPESDVVLDVVSADEGEVTVDPAQLTFTPENWDVGQTVTVTGVDDQEVDGPQDVLVTISVDGTASDPAYGPALDRSVTATNQDDDAAGFTVVQSGGATIVDEAGLRDTLVVSLGTEPATDVVINVSASEPTEATASPQTLTFTPANWATVQRVVVQGVDDDAVDGPQASTVTFTVVDDESDAAYQGLPPQVVDVTTLDDDGAAIQVRESDGSTVVTEGGGTDAFTVQLSGRPSANVVLSIGSADTGEATVNPTSLTFTPDDYDVAQPVTVSGVDDVLVDGDVVTDVTVAVVAASSAAEYSGAAPATIRVTTIDDDGAALVVTQTDGGAAVSETGTTDTFTLELSARPLTDVVVTVSSADEGEVTVAPATLTFTTDTWDAPQTLTVTGVDDDIIDGNQDVDVTLAVDAAQSDPVYQSATPAVVVVTNADDDAPGFTITSGGTVSVSEAGGTAPVTVILNTEPASDVVLDFAITDATVATVGPTTLTFTAANWDTPQAVTVTGVDDDVDTADRETTLTVSVDAAASDDDYDAVADQALAVTAADDDVAGFTFADTTGLSVSETGTTDVFTVVLDAQPLDAVVLTVSSGDPGEVTASPTTLSFTPTNWTLPQAVTLTGVDDSTVDGPIVTAVTVAVDPAQSDDAFDGVVSQAANVTTTDSEAAGFTLADTAALSVSEDGTVSADFTVVLDAAPIDQVAFAVTSGDTGEVTASPTRLTFTATNYSTPQTVTLTGVDEFLVDGDQTTTITIAVDDGGSDDAWDPLANQTASVTTTDDDVAGFTLADTVGLSVPEDGSVTDGFTVVLTGQPASDVVLTVTSGDTGEVTATSPLTFTSGNWSTPQRVTLTGVDDEFLDDSQTTTITVAVDDARSDAAFAGVPNQTTSVTTTDDDGAGFTLAGTAGLSVPEDGSVTDAFTVVLDAAPASSVVLTVTSADPGEVTATSPLTFTSTNWSTPQSVTLTGVDDAVDDGNQQTTITVSVDDAQSDDDFDGLADQLVTVTTVDDDGVGITLDPGTVSVSESGSTATFTVLLNSEPSEGEVVIFDVGSLDTGEATASPAQLTFTRSGGADPWDVPQTVTVTGEDDDLVDGDQTTRVVVIVDASVSDPDYSEESRSVTVTTTDDDAATLVLSTTAVTAVEGGATGTFTVALGAQPSGAVEFSVVSADETQATVSPATLTFTGTTWEDPQTVTVTAVDDDLVDGDQPVDITLDVTSSADTAFADLGGTVTATAEDNDVAGLVLEGGPVAVTEGGGTENLAVRLSSQPTADVTVGFALDTDGQITLSDTTLTFTEANWNADQTVTVSAVDDAVAEGEQVVGLTLSTQTGDATYLAVPDQVTSATVTDNDVAALTLADTMGLTVSEDSTTAVDSFSVVLGAQPQSDVVLSLTSTDTEEVTATPATLTFTNENWSTRQTVDLVGEVDGIVDGSQDTEIIVAVDGALSDDVWASIADTVTVTTTDSDEPALTFDETADTTLVAEGGATDTIIVALAAQPVGTVTLNLTSEPANQITLSPATVSFDATTWNVPDTIIVTAEDDGLPELAEHTADLIFSVDAGSDERWLDFSDTLTVTIQDAAEESVEARLSPPSSGPSDVLLASLAAPLREAEAALAPSH